VGIYWTSNWGRLNTVKAQGQGVTGGGIPQEIEKPQTRKKTRRGRSPPPSAKTQTKGGGARPGPTLKHLQPTMYAGGGKKKKTKSSKPPTKTTY